MTVGVVIRTLNESELIGRCLEVLGEQSGGFDLDVLVVDSGSTDGTVGIARAHGARVTEMRSEQFDYSSALNMGIEKVRGDVIISLSAHAIPTSDAWLDQMTAPFETLQVAAVASRQVPWPNAPWQEVHRLRDQFGAARHIYSKGSAAGLVFSNAASAIRRSVWQEFRFLLPAAEDQEWAHRVIAAGWLVVYEAGATVYHSHDEGSRAQALRMIDLHRVEGNGVWSRARIVRAAAGIFVRDAGKIAGLEEPLRRKLGHLAELLEMVCYYVVDFSRAGTTAERRRDPRAATRKSPGR